MLDDVTLDSYVGEYHSSFGTTWTISRQGGRLMISMPRMGTVRLRPEAPDRFFTFEFDLEFVAERDQRALVECLHLRPSRMVPAVTAKRVHVPIEA
jgi:hypothetical protein